MLLAKFWCGYGNYNCLRVCVYLNVVRMYLTAVSRIRVCICKCGFQYIYLINFTVIFRIFGFDFLFSTK